MPDIVTAALAPEPTPTPVPEPAAAPAVESKPPVEPKPEKAPKPEPRPDVIIASSATAPSLASPARVLSELPPSIRQPAPLAPKTGGRRLIRVGAIVLVLLAGLGIGVGI